ncbi:MAG: hypothetical protein ACOCYN_04405 [Planctomycetota bacterium]
MDFRLSPTSGAGNFFAVSGWSTDPGSIHHPTRGVNQYRNRRYEAILEDGKPEIGDQYRLPADAGHDVAMVEVESVSEEERDGRTVRVVRLRELPA